MKRVKKISIMLMLALLLLFPSRKAFAEERSIYVGDLINIKVTTQSITEDELRDKFADFEIVELKKETDGYIVTVRTFDVGEKTVQLGEEELKITVKSTLEDINRSDIYEGDLSLQKTGLSMEWQFVLYAFLLTFLLTGGITLRRLIRSKKHKALTPYQRFQNQINNIILTEDSCFVKMTLSLKEYMEARYSCSIKGKTTSEIMERISTIPDLQEDRQLLYCWLEDCDIYKYSKAVASMEHKQKLLENLKALVLNMENEKEAET